MIDLDGPFRQRSKKCGVIHFLKGLAAHHIGTNLADKQDHRQRILHRGMDANRGIGRPGTSGDETQARLARQLAPGCRHIGRATFLPAKDQVKDIAMVDHGIQYRQIGFTWHTKGTGRAKCHKAVHYKLAAGSDLGISHLKSSRIRHGYAAVI